MGEIAGSLTIYYHDLQLVARWYKDDGLTVSFFVDASITNDYNGYCMNDWLRYSGVYDECYRLVKEAIA